MINETGAFYLYLHSPLVYTEVPDLSPFESGFPQNETEPDLIFCFELNNVQSGRIDPDADCLLGKLIFAGKSTVTAHGAVTAHSAVSAGDIQVPAGRYLFTQQRRALGMNECISLAVEQQKDGLWEREKPGNLLYIRRLYEDNSPVTQIIREIRN